MDRKLGMIAAAWLAVAGMANAADEAYETALKKLVSAMKEEVEQKNKGGNGGYSDQSKLSMLATIESAGRNSNSGRSLEENLGHVINYFSQPAVKEAAEKLREEVRRMEKESDDAQVAEIDALAERLKQALKTAKEPSEMDSLVDELGGRRRGGYERQTAKSQEQATRLEGLRYIASSWQDYLSAVKNGNEAAARRSLEMMKSNERLTGIIARSELLELETKLRPHSMDPVKVALEITSLADVSGAIAKLKGIRETRESGDYNASQMASQIANALSAIEKNYLQYKEGIPGLLDVGQGSNSVPPQVEGKLVELRAELLRLTIPRYVSAPEGTVAKEGESVADLIKRLEGEFIQKDDLRGALRVRELNRMLSRGYSGGSNQDETGVNAFFSGELMRAARQYQLAVVSYQQALKSGSDLVPVEKITERLAIIRSEHPEDYQFGVERFINPRGAADLDVNRAIQDLPKSAPRGTTPEESMKTPSRILPAKEEPRKSERSKTPADAPGG